MGARKSGCISGRDDYRELMGRATSRNEANSWAYHNLQTMPTYPPCDNKELLIQQILAVFLLGEGRDHG